MASGWSDEYEDQTGGAARLALSVPDGVYLVVLPLSVLAAIPAAAKPDGLGALWLAAASVGFAAFSAAGLAFKARPRRLVKTWRDLAWDKEIAALPGFEYTSGASGAWLVRASTHRKGAYPSVRLLTRESKSEPWDASTFVDTKISPAGDVVVTIGVARTSECDGYELMLVIA
ncbi:hypothetical protein [Terrabacter carboxydivorans]|uniref:Uncharacterized protein n=1 Tax=Terrabacter carboxydivorans TaxID=619730 RepID=A0ABN3MG15_9MICO